VPRFDFTRPEDDVQGPLVGVGEAVDGQIRAAVAENGKLKKLTISPNLLRHTRGGGTFLDSRTLATEITQAVNAAMDDLNRRAPAPDPAVLNGELSHVKTDLDRAINDVRTELERAERRIADR
jgi:hypothetical protein